MNQEKVLQEKQTKNTTLRRINYFRRQTKTKDSQMFKFKNVAEANRMDHKGCGLAVQMLRNTILTHTKMLLSIMCYCWNSSAPLNTPSILEAAATATAMECCKKMMMVSSGALISSSLTMLVDLVTAAGVADGDVRVISDTPEK